MEPYRRSISATPYSTRLQETTIELDWDKLVVQPTKTMLADVIAFIPDLLAAIYILVFGWILAKMLQFVVSRFLSAIHFDALAEKIGSNSLFAESSAKKLSASKWFGSLIFWITIFISVVTVLDRLRLHIASNRLDDLGFLFISAITGIVILTLGMFLSMILSRLVESAAKNLNIPKPALHGNIVKWATLLFTLTLTLSQFGIPADYIFVAIGVIFITTCVTFVIAFGFGGRQWAGKVLDRIY